MMTRFCVGTVFLCLATFWAVAGDDVVIADFEGRDYGDWKVSGKAFGKRPARGTLAKQMRVRGFKGEGLVNSYFGGDDSTGSLTSPPFRIERAYICFLIGGGKYPGETCVNLIIDGKTVRTATGLNGKPGGSEKLDWSFWDVSDYRDAEARIEIVDGRGGGLGHINVDHIVQSDEKPYRELERILRLTARYLNFPVKNGAEMRRITLQLGEESRYFDIELAEDAPDFWAFIDLAAYQGQEAVLGSKVGKDTSPTLLDSLVLAEAPQGMENLYREKHRPQFHFSSKRGWNNDPNGMVYSDGEYHLFYQHNPFGWRWGNMHWGHAVSTDLVHWKELPDALHPDALGTIYSGSAVVDHANTAGFQKADEAVIVAAYTSAGDHAPEPVPYTQSIAYSNDRGRSWTKYAGNPVLGHVAGANRDPKLLWHAPSRSWIMALYLDRNDFALYASPDLKTWEKTCDVVMPKTSECPDFFALGVDGDPGNTRWVFWGANGNYFIGSFDGRTFVPETEMQCVYSGGNAYAAQTFSDIPAEDGRRIQIAWLRQDTPEMPFNQMMSFPVELTLRSTESGVRMFAEPVRELALLEAESQTWTDEPLGADQNLLEAVQGELFRVQAEIEVDSASEIRFTLRGYDVRYQPKEQRLTVGESEAKLAPKDGVIQLEILVDRASIEVFADQGAAYFPMGHLFAGAETGLALSVDGGSAIARSLKVSTLSSAW